MVIMEKIPCTDILIVIKDYNLNGDYVVKLIEGDNVIKYNNVIKICGVKYNKDLDWVVHVMVYKIPLKSFSKEEIESLVFKPFKFKNKKESNLKLFPFFSKPIEKKVNGIIYRRSARYPDYGVAEDGSIINWASGNKLEVKSNDHYKYNAVNIKDNMANTKTSVPVHKIVGLAWCDNDDYIQNNVIDHIDSNKTNNRADNLRWVSESLNQVKEKYNGLDYGIKIRDYKTGEILKFQSQRAIFKWNNGKKINFGHNGCFLRLGKLWNINGSKYEVKYSTDDTPWWYENNTTPPVSLSKEFGKNVEVYNIETKKKYSGSVYDLIKSLNIPKANLYQRLYSNEDHKEISGWLVREKNDKPWPDLTKIKYSINKPKPIYVETDNTIKELPSIKEAERFTLLSQRTVVKYKDTDKVVYNINKKPFKFWSSYSGNRVSEFP